MSEAVMRRLAKPLLFLAAFIWGTSFFIGTFFYRAGH